MRLLFSPINSSVVRPAVLLDRDGVINSRIVDGYVTSWEQFRFVDGMPEALALFADMDVPIVIVSNQAAVGKGLIEPSQLAEITRLFVGQLRTAGARIDAVYYCPHRPSDDCSCRKPRPGLLQQASDDWQIDLRRSVLIGDSDSDMQAAAAVGCMSLLFDSQTDAALSIVEKCKGILEARSASN